MHIILAIKTLKCIPLEFDRIEFLKVIIIISGIEMPKN
jgi:hypothetical protein